MKVIVISGKAGSGKNFIAEKLKKYIEVNYNLKGYVINFADPLKMVCEKVYGWDGVKDEAGRNLLQKVGTDIAHKQDPLTWTKIIIQIIEALRKEFDFVIIGDARFLHEIKGIISHFINGKDATYIVRVLGKLAENNLTDKQQNHKSETDLDNCYDFNYLFDNTNYDMYKFFYNLSNLCYNINIEEW